MKTKIALSITKMDMEKNTTGNKKVIKLPDINEEETLDSIKTFIVKNIEDASSTGAVIGLSGGIDSTLTATITKKAFDNYNEDGNNSKSLELIGLIVPSDINSDKDMDKAINLANKLGIKYRIIDIEDIKNSFLGTKEFENLTTRAKGNLISRIRANVLSTIAEIESKTIIGTGNHDEDFGIGYYTLFGDGAVHISPIAMLSKRLVYKMAKYLDVSEEIINAMPTAGLEFGQTDFSDLGYSYDLVELVKEALDQGFTESEIYANSNVIKTGNRDIKKYSEVFSKSKFQSVQEMVYDIISRNNNAKLKAKVIAPPVAKINLKYN